MVRGTRTPVTLLSKPDQEGIKPRAPERERESLHSLVLGDWDVDLIWE